ncbi:hypothetical protein [Corynebacterium pseudodiphtheriticum]|uniref:hypothetical protein n=1 Tax=Corynebacterium pseudodiphtheriticum TaxID=37637 RepID=UPI00234C4CCF|nr:hypothetical protein [Corynebacterium pseudodiphtheriticum]MDC7087816.1 hypothetical protein [Corynebacterium pseudodiphtheriticum]
MGSTDLRKAKLKMLIHHIDYLLMFEGRHFPQPVQDALAGVIDLAEAHRTEAT